MIWNLNSARIYEKVPDPELDEQRKMVKYCGSENLNSQPQARPSVLDKSNARKKDSIRERGRIVTPDNRLPLKRYRLRY